VPNSSVVIAPGQGLENQKTAGAALDPTTGALYLGFLNRNTTAPTEIARVNDPTSATPVVDFIANATRHKPIFTLAFIGPDLYVGNNGGLDWIQNAQSCAPGACASIQLLNVRGPRGMASDGVDHIYMAGPAIPGGCPPTCPAPGTLTTPVQVYTISTGDLSTFSSQGTLANGTLSDYDVVDSITVDPKGNVYVGDDPNVLGTPTGQGRVFKVSAISAEPTPALTSKPNNPTNQNKPAFSFQSADASATFKCSFTTFGAADAFSTCGGTGSGSVTYGLDATGKIVPNGANPVADGLYQFRVEGIGASGTSVPQSFVFTIDTVAPVLTITSQPKSLTNVNTPTLAFSSDTAQTTFMCALTAAGGVDQFVACTSPTTYAAQPDGAYTFTVKATDAAGNQAAAKASFTIDATPPTVTANPPGGLYASAQSVVLTASEPATIYYTRDGTAPTTASTSTASPLTLSVAANTTLKYFAVDPAGNASAVATQTYQIGALNLTQNPPVLGNSNTPTFAFSDFSPTATFQCSLVLQSAVDAFSPCTSPIAYAAQPDGAYRFVVQDSGGNSVQYLFTIDTTPPVVTLSQNPQNPDASSSATFAWTSSEAGTTYQCSFGLATASNPAAACTSPVTYSGLADGNYLFTLQGTDAAGNKATLVSYPFSVRAAAPPTVTQAPKATLLGLTTGQAGAAPVVSTGPLTADATKGVPVTISWAGTACLSGVTNCNIDHYVLQESINGLAFGAVALPSPTATSVVRTLKVSPTNNSQPATTYRYQVQAVDKSGAVSAVGAGASFIVPDTDNSFNTSFNGSWSGVNLTGAFGGSVQQSSTANATANPATAQTATSFALVSTLGPDRGIAQIKVDGTVVATVDLYAATLQPAQVVWAWNGLAAGSQHQVQVVVTGTKNASATQARVDYDAILALK
jgi:chitobiase/beta-hexosaminidase-like protein/Big-like domain-containing protein